jgi:hypothetical protein
MMNTFVDETHHRPEKFKATAARSTRVWTAGLLLLSPAGLLGASRPAGLETRAADVLERALREETGFVRVHAAEALLGTGRGDVVRAALPAWPGADADATPALARIGVWRVRALASATSDERESWISQVRRVALEPAAPDQLQAVETLGKLHVQLDPNELRAIRGLAVNWPPATASLPWWVLHLNGAPDALPRIVETLSAAEPVARLRAAYVLKRDRLTGDGARPALARACAAEPAGSIAYPYLLCAMAALTENPAEQADCVDRLGQLLAGPSASGRYEVTLTLMELWPDGNAGRFAALLDSPDADSRIGAAWAILHLTRRSQ